jgi:benzil reductase ((S)-benzoin forming)
LKQAIITGTSRGLGKAYAEVLLEQGWKVIGISRTHTIDQGNYFPVEADLSKAGVASQLELPISHLAEEFLLISNAATLGDIGYLGEISDSSIEASLMLNVISSSILINRFLAQTSNKKRTLISISSGASQNAYDGWGIYCSSKSAMDMLMDAIIKEREIRNDSLTRIYSFAPGVIDTEMQEKIRSSNPDQFSKLERFQELKQNGQLASAVVVARQCIELLVNGQSFSSGRYDIRNLTSI